MTTRLGALIVDAADPSALARFWHRMLGGELRDDNAGAVLSAPGVELRFRVDDERITPNRWRWTLRVDDAPMQATMVDRQGNEFELY
jgi:hypothetical protein